jgi:hypothetical protein
MPNRILREGILTSEKIAQLGWPEEVFYRRLLSIVDDYGRFEAGIQLLRSKCYPLQVDDVRVADITRWMAACQTAGLILFYAVHDKQYLEVINFGQQQRTASKFPAPPSDASNCYQKIASAHLGVSVSGDVSVDGGGKRETRPNRKAPKEFEVTEAMRIWGTSDCPGVDIDRATAKFLDHTFKTSMTDWLGAWRNWIRKDFEFLPVNKFAKPASNITVSVNNDIARTSAMLAADAAIPRHGPSLEVLARMAQIKQGIAA